jgi:forespore regulator of the sigma-K checkpoint
VYIKRSIIFILLAFILLGFNKYDAALLVHAQDTEETFQNEPLEVQVVLERMYLDGEFSQEIVKETIWSMEDFWAKYDSWQLIDMTDDKVVFREFVDDISPLLKTNGYFGISEDGTLTIFNGRPQTSKIIHTFFQLDIGKLESKKHEELKQGIPIKNKDQYVEVLETFKNYTLEEKQAN